MSENDQLSSPSFIKTEEQEAVGAVSAGLLQRLQEKLPALSPTERQIGEYILAQPRRVLRFPSDQLAKEIGVSQGTLSNFCQALGYTGFRAFRLDLAAEVNSPLKLDYSDIARGDTLQEIANKAISANIEALLTTLKGLNLSEIEKVTEAIGQARRIDLYAIGISAAVAYDAFTRLWGMGLNAAWLPDISHQIASAGFITERDVAIAFSYAGETTETVKALSIAHQNGATTVAITGNPHSSLARYADLKLIVSSREPTAFSRNLRISSRMSMLGIVDIIYLGLLNALDDATFARVERVYQLYHRVEEPKPKRQA